MGTHAATTSAATATSTGYSFFAYPGTEYPMSPGGYPVSAMAHMELSGMPPLPYAAHFPANLAFAHLAHGGGGAPSSRIATHALPLSPTIMHSSNAAGTGGYPPSSPDRSFAHAASSAAGPAELKVMRQLITAMTKLQSTMKDVAERQEQILDRMSLLEQRVGRMDDGVERIIENTEAVLEDNKSILKRVEDNDSQDEFETRLTDLMDGVVDKLIGGIAEEIKDIKKQVKDTEKYVKLDPFSWSSKLVMAQRMADAALVGKEPQAETHAP